MTNTVNYLPFLIALACGLIGFALGRWSKRHTLKVELDSTNITAAIEHAIASVKANDPPSGGFLNAGAIDVETNPRLICANCDKDMDWQYRQYILGGRGVQVWHGERGMYCCETCRRIASLCGRDPLSTNYTTGKPGCEMCRGAGHIETLRSSSPCACTLPADVVDAHGSGPLPGTDAEQFVASVKAAVAPSGPRSLAGRRRELFAETDEFGNLKD